MYPADQIDELKELCPGLCHFEEAGTGYLVLPAMEMPPGCQPAKADMLLCPGGRDGYGAAGSRPQVVWPNGILASSAVGVAVNAITGWTGKTPSPIYLSYDGNSGLVQVHPRLEYLPVAQCPHYPLGKIGKPVLERL